ncbi:BZ3500_MvSof-1268-A1-R1_Chr2-2g04958 [Microbotryum saponariae]|uniref:BZ3500_MvSof-1268-A1-R1_Chr2-2g04958 protein n=1 Tax=Microbotryum saponariae TaxID=289078 RepID=A0A2X0K4A7_9BASI|nr:BZ3500_MvSof-1268-A1-R1_Chr2-2g04958 [Microbotryum saponariae]SDA00565.1 BZ3501_MvSof-1269-A2-R1_Chr2-2g04632 [Microbotryum saponariae]
MGREFMVFEMVTSRVSRGLAVYRTAARAAASSSRSSSEEMTDASYDITLRPRELPGRVGPARELDRAGEAQASWPLSEGRRTLCGTTGTGGGRGART